MDLTLPDGASLGDEGHIDDHNLIVAAIQSLNAGKIETLTVGSVTTAEADVEAQATLNQSGPGTYALSLVIPRGTQGDVGATGSAGAQGDPGIGMPTGGTTGQYIKKNSNANYDYTFGTPTASEVGAVPTSRQVVAGTGLSGGGDLSADRTLSVAYGTTSGTALEGTQLGNSKGLSGAAQATRYAGATASGAPTTGTFAVGDYVISQAGSVFICTAAGTPGTWAHIPNTTWITTQIGSLANAPAGTMVNVNESGGAYTRPTARTDICVVFTGTSDPASVALPGDKWDRI